MTDLQKKYKEIACAFAPYAEYSDLKYEESYEKWLLTEEGKRLTAEEESKIRFSLNGNELPIEQAAVQALKEISTSLKQLNDNQIVMNEKIDRFEGRLRGDLFRD